MSLFFCELIIESIFVWTITFALNQCITLSSITFVDYNYITFTKSCLPIFVCRHFDLDDKSAKESAKLFSVPDFVGDACKAIASRIRGAVAGVQFDDFHKVSNADCKLKANWYITEILKKGFPNTVRKVVLNYKEYLL